MTLAAWLTGGNAHHGQSTALLLCATCVAGPLGACRRTSPLFTDATAARARVRACSPPVKAAIRGATPAASCLCVPQQLPTPARTSQQHCRFQRSTQKTRSLIPAQSDHQHRQQLRCETASTRTTCTLCSPSAANDAPPWALIARCRRAQMDALGPPIQSPTKVPAGSQ
jgi:hypothetical protein